MAFRFWRRIKIAPGVTLNLSKSGGSLSFGPRGAKFTVGSRGKRATVGIPETGLFYTTTLPSGRSGGRRSASYFAPTVPTVRPEDRLTMGFFKRLITLDDEEALVEVYQRQERWQDAIACLERLRRLEPNDVVVRLFFVELLLDARLSDKNICQKVVRLVEGIENDTPIHAALMLYKAKALRHLGLAIAARDTLTAALRRKKGRSGDLLRALRYERALVYEDLGQRQRVRSELEKLYAEDADYEDVAERLGR